MRNITCFLGVYGIFLHGGWLWCAYVYSVLDKLVFDLTPEAGCFASCVWVWDRVMAKSDCWLICALVNYTTTVEHYCAVRGTIWIGKVHALNFGRCVPGFRRLHLFDQAAPSPALEVEKRSRNKACLPILRFGLRAGT